jgi:hypothetical protein
MHETEVEGGGGSVPALIICGRVILCCKSNQREGVGVVSPVECRFRLLLQEGIGAQP